MPDLAASPPPNWKLWLQFLSVVRWLGGTRRALGSWLRSHREQLLERCFKGRDSVKRRAGYVDLGNESDVIAWLADVQAERSTAAWIRGPGGCGKSTLAFRMSRAAPGEAARPVTLPVLVEEDWGDSSVVEHIAQLLRVRGRRPTPTMIRKLGHMGLLLPIVDGLSERRVANPVGQVTELVRSGAFRHLLVTSRDAAPEPSPFHEINVGPMEDDCLEAFVREHSGATNVNRFLTEIRRLTQGQPIGPLFARLAVDQLRQGGTLPESYATLVQDYVRAIRPKGEHALREDDFLRAARVTARLCLDEELVPRPVAADFLRGHLTATGETLAFEDEKGTIGAGSVIDQLLQCGLLQRDVVLAVPHVKFAEDPVAEYLTAADVVAQGPEAAARLGGRLTPRSGGLREALDRVEQAPGRTS